MVTLKEHVKFCRCAAQKIAAVGCFLYYFLLIKFWEIFRKAFDTSIKFLQNIYQQIFVKINCVLDKTYTDFLSLKIIMSLNIL